MFISDTDIIVWKNTIGRYSALKFYIEENDKVRLADSGEIVQYFNRRNETF
jgi:hypothetical protein